MFNFYLQFHTLVIFFEHAHIIYKFCILDPNRDNADKGCKSTSDTEAPFLDLHLSISNGFVSSKIYDKRDLDFDTVNFPFLDGDVPHSTAYPGLHF